MREKEEKRERNKNKIPQAPQARVCGNVNMNYKVRNVDVTKIFLVRFEAVE